MKKLLAGLFIFGALTLGLKADALTFSEALLKIQSLTQELNQLKSNLKASVADPNLPSISDIVATPSWSSMDLRFNVSSPTTITEVGYCLKKVSSSTPCVRNVIRGLSSYTNARISLASIEPTTNYTLYLYAKNSYGEEKSSDINFTSLAVPFEAYETTPIAYFSPVVKIYPAPVGLTSSTAAVGGYVTNLGSTGSITERGACYGSSSSSMTSCMTAYLVQGPGDMFATKFVGLTPNTKYYYRVYAKNSTETVYSAYDSFTTLAGSADLTPVNGGWSSWSNSGSCVNNLQTQTRTCTNPSPLNGGTNCSGVTTQQISCSSPVNGGWTSWSNSGGCVNNLQIQTRTCTNPSPSNGGTICSGVSAQQISCSTGTPSITLTSSNENTVVSDTAEKGVLRFNIKAENSSANLNSFKIILENKNKSISSSRLSDYITEVNTYSEGVQIGALKASDFSMMSTGLYSKTLPIALGVNPILNGQNKDYYIKVKMNPSLSSDNISNLWNITVTSVRYTDSTGVVRVSDSSAVNTFSVKPFSNESSSITVLSPNGGETYNQGNSIEVKWSSSNILSTKKIGITLVSNLGDAIEIGTSSLNDGYEVVTLPTKLNWSKMSNSTKYKINVSTVYSVDAEIVFEDGSDNLFTITAPNVTCMTIAEPAPTFCVGGKIVPTIDLDGCITKYTCTDTALDSTPRISVWQGKVNQHVDAIGKWQTDSDGVSGAELNKIIYCNKFYPGTTSVSEYKLETINTWHDRGNVSNYTSTRMSYKCVGGGKYVDPSLNSGCSGGDIYSSTTGQKCPDSTISSITVTSPNEGTYKTGDSILVKWSSNNLAAGNYMRISLTDGVNYYRQDKTFNTGSYSYMIGNDVKSASTYKIVVGLDSSGRDIKDFSDNYFTISSTVNEPLVDSTCTGGAIFSSMTGKRCSEINEIRDTGCIAGQNFSSITGKPCANGLYKNDDANSNLIPTGESAPMNRTLKRGVTGDDVKRLQEFLQIYADGVFGRGTAAKVKEWQLNNGLYPDGSFGPKSRATAGL